MPPSLTLSPTRLSPGCVANIWTSSIERPIGKNGSVAITLRLSILRNQAKDIQKSIHEELKRIREGYKSDLAIAKKNEQELRAELASIIAQIPNEAQVSLRGLEGAAQSYHSFGEKFLQTYNESVQQQSAPFPETRVIAYATYSYKSYPSPARIFSLALLGGLALGVGICVTCEK